jgi:hypothetical protein
MPWHCGLTGPEPARGAPHNGIVGVARGERGGGLRSQLVELRGAHALVHASGNLLSDQHLGKRRVRGQGRGVRAGFEPDGLGGVLHDRAPHGPAEGAIDVLHCCQHSTRAHRVAEVGVEPIAELVDARGNFIEPYGHLGGPAAPWACVRVGKRSKSILGVGPAHGGRPHSNTPLNTVLGPRPASKPRPQPYLAPVALDDVHGSGLRALVGGGRRGRARRSELFQGAAWTFDKRSLTLGNGPAIGMGGGPMRLTRLSATGRKGCGRTRQTRAVRAPATARSGTRR